MFTHVKGVTNTNGNTRSKFDTGDGGAYTYTYNVL